MWLHQPEHLMNTGLLPGCRSKACNNSVYSGSRFVQQEKPYCKRVVFLLQRDLPVTVVRLKEQ